MGNSRIFFMYFSIIILSEVCCVHVNMGMQLKEETFHLFGGLLIFQRSLSTKAEESAKNFKLKSTPKPASGLGKLLQKSGSHCLIDGNGGICWVGSGRVRVFDINHFQASSQNPISSYVIPITTFSLIYRGELCFHPQWIIEVKSSYHS